MAFVSNEICAFVIYFEALCFSFNKVICVTESLNVIQWDKMSLTKSLTHKIDW